MISASSLAARSSLWPVCYSPCLRQNRLPVAEPKLCRHCRTPPSFSSVGLSLSDRGCPMFTETVLTFAPNDSPLAFPNSFEASWWCLKYSGSLLSHFLLFGLLCRGHSLCTETLIEFTSNLKCFALLFLSYPSSVCPHFLVAPRAPSQVSRVSISYCTRHQLPICCCGAFWIPSCAVSMVFVHWAPNSRITLTPVSTTVIWILSDAASKPKWELFQANHFFSIRKAS